MTHPSSKAAGTQIGYHECAGRVGGRTATGTTHLAPLQCPIVRGADV